MAKNALQAQLLKAGLVDSKKAKKLSKQSQHDKRTGDSSNIEAKKALAEAQAKKVEKDQKLNQEKQQILEQKTLRANIIQMIKQHQIKETVTGTESDVSYQFVDQSKIKKIHVTQKLYEQVVAGHVVIARLEEGYALLPRPLADRIDAKLEGFIVVSNDKSDTELDDDDPYAAYVIPDDLMW